MGSEMCIRDRGHSDDVNYGQFVVGVFIADDTKQSIGVSGMKGKQYDLGRCQVNAIQLRMID